MKYPRPIEKFLRRTTTRATEKTDAPFHQLASRSMSEIPESEKNLLFPEARILDETPVRGVLQYSVTSSTNDVAKALLASDSFRNQRRLPCGLDFPVLICAREQTSGRGRGAKSWWTGAGAIAFSLLLNFRDLPVVRDDLPGISPLLARCVIETFVETSARRVTGQHLEVHPPNDVYLHGKKICGILIESPCPDAAIFGIGVNTNNTKHNLPAEFREIALTTYRDETGLRLDNTDFLVTLVGKILAVLNDP